MAIDILRNEGYVKTTSGTVGTLTSTSSVKPYRETGRPAVGSLCQPRERLSLRMSGSWFPVPIPGNRGTSHNRFLGTRGNWATKGKREKNERTVRRSARTLRNPASMCLVVPQGFGLRSAVK